MGIEQELASLKQRRRSVDPGEVHALLTEAGFDRRYGKGDHWVYTHRKRRFPLTIDLENRCFLHTCPRQSGRSRRCSPMRTLEEYLELPYTIEIVHDHDDDGNDGYVADVKELPGVISQGETIEEAASSVHDAMVGWISVALEDGLEIPEPRDVEAYSGRFLLRLPRSLHADLARRAEEEGVSLNQYVATTLARAAGSHRSRELV